MNLPDPAVGDSRPAISRNAGADESAGHAAKWNLATKVAFRFMSVFLFLFLIPFPFEFDADEALPSVWHRVVPWVASHVTHLSRQQALSGTYYLYLQLLTIALISGVVTLLWSVIDRKRPNYSRLHDWMQLYVRLCLAAIVFAYASSKLFPEQFRAPSLARLLQPFGDFGLNGLMWNFIGASRLYTIFAGAVEAIAAITLFIPRLRTLGALLCGLALTNVLILDLSYDVDVWLYCSVLLLMCAFLLAPDMRKLVDFFVLHRKIDPAPARPLFRRKWMQVAALCAQFVFAFWVIGHCLSGDRRDSGVRDQALRNNPLRGIWLVDEFQDNQKVLPPLMSDPVRWQRVVIDSPPSATNDVGFVNLFTIQSMNGSLSSLEMNLDLSRHILLLKSQGGSAWTGQFTVSQLAKERLALDGYLGQRQIHAELRLTHPQFFLNRDHFHLFPTHTLDPWNP